MSRAGASSRWATARGLGTVPVLALGFAVAAALFTVFWDVVARPLPYAGQQSLVTVWTSDVPRGVAKLELSWNDVLALRKEARSLAQAEACSAANFGTVLRDRDRPVQLQANLVSAGLLRTLGVRPVVGRTFAAAEHRAGGPAVALLSYRAWQRLYGGDRSVTGRSVSFDGQKAEIVGVLPPRVELPAGAEVIFPLEPQTVGSAGDRVLMGVARLRPGVTAAAARPEIAAILRAEERLKPGGRQDLGGVVAPLLDELLGPHRPALIALLVMSLLVLATAVANASGLLLRHGIARREEVAVRRALGARTARLLALFGGEAARITVPAAALGALGSTLLQHRFVALAPPEFPRLAEVGSGHSGGIFLLAVAVLTTLALAGVPLAAQVGGRAPAVELRGAGRSGGLRRPLLAALDTLVVAQVALAITLASAAVLAATTYGALRHIDPGFSRTGVLTAQLPLSYNFAADAAAEGDRAKMRELFARLGQIPGVTAAGGLLMRPLEMEQGWDFTFTAEGQDATTQHGNPLANLLSATPGAFPALGVRTLAGRTLGEDDGAQSPRVAVVSESLARHMWGSPAAAIGHRLKSGLPSSDRPWLTVVGVVADVRYRGIQIVKPDLYVPYTQSSWRPTYLVLRTSVEPRAVLAAVRRVTEALYPDAPLSRTATAADLIDAKLAPSRLDALVLALFSGSALVLALLGIFAALAFLVQARRLELSIRSALGAEPRKLLGLVLGRAGRLVLLGSVAGAALSIAAVRALAAWRAAATAPPLGTLALAMAAIALLGLLASLLPARGAAAANPVATLR